MTPGDLNADIGEGVSGDAGLDPADLVNLLLQQVHERQRRVRGPRRRRRVHGARVPARRRARCRRGRPRVADVTLRKQLLAQLETLRTHAATADGRVAYLKAHGALYGHCSRSSCARSSLTGWSPSRSPWSMTVPTSTPSRPLPA